MYLFMGVVIGSAVVPIALAMGWAKVNGKGMTSGALGGAACGIIVWLSVASTFPGGLSKFLDNTGINNNNNNNNNNHFQDQAF